jgi:hypothetical protein
VRPAELPPTDARDAVARARQAHAAAELLWLRGDRREALDRARAALALTLEVASGAGTVDAAATQFLESTSVSSVSRAVHGDAWVLPLLRARRRVERRWERATERPAARRARRLRWGVAAWCALVAVVAAALYRPHVPTATATASLAASDFFGPARALDDDPATAWLLPDHTAGTLRIELAPPRDVHALTLAQPAPSTPLRGTASARVRLLRGSRVLVEQAVTLPASAPQDGGVGVDGAGFGAAAVTVPITGRGVTRVEVEVESSHGAGGGLAEVELQ